MNLSLPSSVWNEKCNLKSLERVDSFRVLNEALERNVPQGSGVRVPLKVWKEVFPQWSGTRGSLKDLKRGISSKIWNEEYPHLIVLDRGVTQESGTRRSLKGLKRGVL